MLCKKQANFQLKVLNIEETKRMSKKSRIQSKMNSGSKFSFNNILKVIIYLVVSRKAPNCANP